MKLFVVCYGNFGWGGVDDVDFVCMGGLRLVFGFW